MSEREDEGKMEKEAPDEVTLRPPPSALRTQNKRSLKDYLGITVRGFCIVDGGRCLPQHS